MHEGCGSPDSLPVCSQHALCSMCLRPDGPGHVCRERDRHRSGPEACPNPPPEYWTDPASDDHEMIEWAKTDSGTRICMPMVTGFYRFKPPLSFVN